MIDLTGNTYQSILQEMLDRIPNTYDKRDGSFMQTAIGPAAYALQSFYITLNNVQRSAFIQTAVGTSLDMLSAIGGITRYPASPAVRLGIFNTSVPIGARFSTINGAESINFTVTASTDTAGQYQLTAETPGQIGNSYVGAILPITYVEGLNSAQITDILVPGDDEETDEALRDRLITALNQRPFGGNIAAYRENILGIAGVGAVQVYPTWNGGGTVKCSILGADLLPASETLIQNVQNAIDPVPQSGLGLGLAPIGAQVTISAPVTVTINVRADITLAAGYSLEQVQGPIQNAIDTYIISIRQSWGTPINDTEVLYASNVYLSRVVAAIVGTAGVANATGVQLNGTAGDLELTETGAVQQVPVLGTVTLNAV